MNEEQKKLEKWQSYVDEMKDQNPEQYLAGDLQGYRRGYSDGLKDERKTTDQEKTDLTLAGVLLIVLLAGSVGVLIGMAFDIVKIVAP